MSTDQSAPQEIPDLPKPRGRISSTLTSVPETLTQNSFVTLCVFLAKRDEVGTALQSHVHVVVVGDPPDPRPP